MFELRFLVTSVSWLLIGNIQGGKQAWFPVSENINFVGYGISGSMFLARAIGVAGLLAFGQLGRFSV